jgi:hypothetical protein
MCCTRSGSTSAALKVQHYQLHLQLKAAPIFAANKLLLLKQQHDQPHVMLLINISSSISLFSTFSAATSAAENELH